MGRTQKTTCIVYNSVLIDVMSFMSKLKAEKNLAIVIDVSCASKIRSMQGGQHDCIIKCGIIWLSGPWNIVSTPWIDTRPLWWIEVMLTLARQKTIKPTFAGAFRTNQSYVSPNFWLLLSPYRSLWFAHLIRSADIGVRLYK